MVNEMLVDWMMAFSDYLDAAASKLVYWKSSRWVCSLNSSYLTPTYCRHLQAALEDFSEAWSLRAVYSLYDHALG